MCFPRCSLVILCVVFVFSCVSRVSQVMCCVICELFLIDITCIDIIPSNQNYVLCDSLFVPQYLLLRLNIDDYVVYCTHYSTWPDSKVKAIYTFQVQRPLEE